MFQYSFFICHLQHVKINYIIKKLTTIWIHEWSYLLALMRKDTATHILGAGDVKPYVFIYTAGEKHIQLRPSTEIFD